MKQWQAQWVTDPDFAELTPRQVEHRQLEVPEQEEHRADLRHRHTLFRGAFDYQGGACPVLLDISGDDYFKVYINGCFAGQGPAPSVPDHYGYLTLDITPWLRTGRNVIAVHVYYQGLINRVWNSGDYRQGMIAEVSEGERLLLASGKHWKCARHRGYTGTETIGYETQYKEDYDSRLEEKNWEFPDFSDAHWLQATEKKGDDHCLVPQSIPPLEISDREPRTLQELEPGLWQADFGSEVVGQLKLSASGVPGETVEVLHGEELDDQGRVRYLMRCNCDYRDVWTLSGGQDTFRPFDYKAFRYAEIRCRPGVADMSSLRAVVRHYPVPEARTTFEAAVPLLKDIWDLCEHSVRMGTQEVFVDCPSREKGQYLGDATVTGHAHMLLTGDLRMTRKCLEDFARSTRICPGMMAVAPGSFMQEIADFSLQWPMQLWTWYLHSGDLDFLRSMAPVAEGILSWFRQHCREDGLLENVRTKWNLVDWPQNLRDDYDFDLSPVPGEGCHNVINAFYIGAEAVTDQIREALGQAKESRFPALKEAFVRTFRHAATGRFRDAVGSEHCALHASFIPLFFGLVPQEDIPGLAAWFRQRGMHCGVYNTYFLLHGLAAAGEHALVYDLLTSQDEHSWANMLREGATTCFEAWGKEQKWNTSLCHPWASSPVSVLTEALIGLKPGAPGWKRIRFEPRVPEVMGDFSLSLMTACGRVTVKRTHGVYSLKAPAGVPVDCGQGTHIVTE